MMIGLGSRLLLVLGASGALAHTIDVFAEYETKIVLDMKADGVFRVMS
jgi:hypothetical protein